MRWAPGCAAPGAAAAARCSQPQLGGSIFTRRSSRRSVRGAARQAQLFLAKSRLLDSGLREVFFVCLFLFFIFYF